MTNHFQFNTPTLVMIVGPTAVGKTKLAIQLAQAFGTEIVSVDSRQCYREMSIGTAVPHPDELALVPHHFIHSHSIHSEMNVSDFEKQAILTLSRLFQQHAVAIAVGGSGLYVRALCEGFDELPTVHFSLRQVLNERLQWEGIEALQQQLKQLDPVYYQEVDLQNPQRIIRALEVCLASNKPFSSFRKSVVQTRPFKIIKIGLNVDRTLLYQRIEHRVDQMVLDGLVNEVEQLIPFKNLNSLHTVGYTELFDYFAEKYSLEQAIQVIKQHTRRFAKRQLTWFRKDPAIEWFQPHQYDEIFKYIVSSL